MAELAYEVFQTYGIGHTKANNGLLLFMLVTPEQYDIHIEVGYGLEAYITDSHAGAILDEYALPELQNGEPNIALGLTYLELAEELMTFSTQEGFTRRGSIRRRRGRAKMVTIIDRCFL